MNGYLVIIGVLILYIFYLHLQLWLAKQRLRAVRPIVVISNGSPETSGGENTSGSGGCGALFLLVLLLAIVLYLILSAIQ
jgi:hypothetical protein